MKLLLVALLLVAGCRSFSYADPAGRQIHGQGLLTEPKATAIDVESPSGWKIHYITYGSNVNADAVGTVVGAMAKVTMGLLVGM